MLVRGSSLVLSIPLPLAAIETTARPVPPKGNFSREAEKYRNKARASHQQVALNLIHYRGFFQLYTRNGINL